MKNKELLRLILQHLLINPDAGDTIVGITGWWVAQELLSIRLKEVAEAVDVLVQEGMLIEKIIPGSDKIYFVNTNKLDEIRDRVDRKN